MVSSTSAATVKPCLLMQRSMILPSCFLPHGEGDLVVEDVLGIAAVHEAQILRDVLVEDDAADGRRRSLRGCSVSPLTSQRHGAPGSGSAGPTCAVVVGHESFVRVAGRHVERLDRSAGLLALSLQSRRCARQGTRPRPRCSCAGRLVSPASAHAPDGSAGADLGLAACGP